MAERRTVKRASSVKPKENKDNIFAIEIAGLVITVLGIITLFGFYTNTTGPFGILIKRISLGLFGIPAYIMSPIIIFIGVYLMIKHSLKPCLNICLPVVGLFIVISSMFHLFSGLELTVSEYYEYGTMCRGGGFFGGLIETPLRRLTGSVGSFLILLALIIIFVMIITKIKLSDIYAFISEKIKKLYSKSKEKNTPADKKAIPGSHSEPKITKQKDNNGKQNVISDIPFNPDEIKIFSHDQLGMADAAEDNDDNSSQSPQNKDSVKAEPPVPTTEIEEEIMKNKQMIDYKFPSTSMLEKHSSKAVSSKPDDLRESARKLVETLDSFGVKTKVLEVSRGPSVTRFELQPSVGVKVSKIVNLADDIALNLAAAGVRIEAPIPGKAAVGIEIPNQSITTVALREVLESKEFTAFTSKTAFALGKDIAGKTIVADISKMPHLLIAGATGSGKSVCINTLISSILFKAHPDEVKLLMIDPKMVELEVYNGIPHLLIPVVTDARKAAEALNWAVTEMTRRYKLFADCNVRNISGYNEYALSEGLRPLEKIIIIIDELADLMMVSPKDVEDAICRLAQLARAAGMHLVIATQRPSADVITGLIKTNIPSRISFAVSSHIDSRIILDMMGAEKLLGRGDMLYLPFGASKPIRVQGAFVSDKEVENIVEFVKTDCEASYDEDIIESIERDDSSHIEDDPGDNDEYLKDAIEMVVDSGQASVSMVQRRFKVGYARAGRIIDQMEQRGIIGPHEGSKPRNVLITKQQFYEMFMNEESDE